MSEDGRVSFLIHVRFMIDIFQDGSRPSCHDIYGSRTLLGRSVNSIYHLDDDRPSYGWMMLYIRDGSILMH
jgi:hypothetical protein